MEDLVLLLIFAGIGLINLVKFLAEKSGKNKSAPAQPAAPPRRRSHSLEDFFENLAEQIAPAPRKIPDWPEGFERPDYLQEMEAFEEEPPVAAVEPLPPPPVPAEFQPLENPVTVQPARKSSRAMLSGSHGLRMPGMSSGTGRSSFRIEGKNDLKSALLGHIVFSPPRAYDLSFDNTIAK